MIPAPVILLDKGIFIAPEIAELFGHLGPEFEEFYTNRGFNWRRLAGAEVRKIGGIPAWEYIGYISDNVAGVFLDFNVRVNFALSGYMMRGLVTRQRLGILASRNFLMETSLEFSVVPVNATSTEPEHVKVPFVAVFNGAPFKDKES
jgi:hypothetical protein